MFCGRESQQLSNMDGGQQRVSGKQFGVGDSSLFYQSRISGSQNGTQNLAYNGIQNRTHHQKTGRRLDSLRVFSSASTNSQLDYSRWASETSGLASDLSAVEVSNRKQPMKWFECQVVDVIFSQQHASSYTTPFTSSQDVITQRRDDGESHFRSSVDNSPTSIQHEDCKRGHLTIILNSCFVSMLHLSHPWCPSVPVPGKPSSYKITRRLPAIRSTTLLCSSSTVTGRRRGIYGLVNLLICKYSSTSALRSKA